MTTATINVNEIVKDGISAPVKGPALLPPGQYWVGDLGYVISDGEWASRVCKTYYKDCAVTLESGDTALLFCTVKGDGLYRTSRGFWLGVDSGSIGILPLSAIDESAPALTKYDRGAVVTFPEEFTCEQQRDDNLLLFGDVKIYL